MEKSSPKLLLVRFAEISLRIGRILRNILGDLIAHNFELHLGPQHVLQFLVGQLREVI